MRTWYLRGKDTIAALITTWAPPSENDTAAYIKFVSDRVGINPDQKFVWTEYNAVRIAHAIAQMENGVQPELTTALFYDAYNLI